MKTATVYIFAEQAPTREKFSLILKELNLDNNYNVVADYGNPREIAISVMASDDVKDADYLALIHTLLQKLTDK